MSHNRQFKRMIRRQRRNCLIRLHLLGFISRLFRMGDNLALVYFRGFLTILVGKLAAAHEKREKTLDDFRLM